MITKRKISISINEKELEELKNQKQNPSKIFNNLLLLYLNDKETREKITNNYYLDELEKMKNEIEKIKNKIIEV